MRSDWNGNAMKEKLRKETLFSPLLCLVGGMENRTDALCRFFFGSFLPLLEGMNLEGNSIPPLLFPSFLHQTKKTWSLLPLFPPTKWKINLKSGVKLIDEDNFLLLKAWMELISDVPVTKESWPDQEKLIIKYQLRCEGILAFAAAKWPICAETWELA